MKGKSLSILAASLLASLPALAGINPASPGLPTVTAAAAPGATYAANVPNNQMSAMCVDCHTRAPKPAMGTHFVAVTAGETNSGGSGVNAAGAVIVRDTGEYFKTGLWNAGGANGAANYSKYGNGTLSYVPATVSGSGTATPLAITNAMEIICESCHNVVVNEAGGNNLLEAQNAGVAGNAANDYISAITASMMCVGCHGFMYNTAAPATGANYGDTRNISDIPGVVRRGNNEWHFAANAAGAQTAYAQNHHVMTGDVINAAQAAAGVLWTDNIIVSYTEAPISNTSAQGSFPVNQAWTGTGIAKPANGGLTCTNCHAPGHGGGITEGGSILRNAVSTANAGVGRTNAWSRINETAGGGGWKSIRDLAYCGQCHKN